MIFVTVGTSRLGFDRLVKQLDEDFKLLNEDIIIQRGYSKYVPKNIVYLDFVGREEILDLINKANIIITHAGFGILGDCIRYKKRIIVVPREKKYGEAVNPQVELAEYLAHNYQGIICVRDVTNLQSAINQIKNITPDYHFTNNIPQIIQNFIHRRLN